MISNQNHSFCQKIKIKITNHSRWECGRLVMKDFMSKAKAKDSPSNAKAKAETFFRPRTENYFKANINDKPISALRLVWQNAANQLHALKIQTIVITMLASSKHGYSWKIGWMRPLGWSRRYFIRCCFVCRISILTWLPLRDEERVDHSRFSSARWVVTSPSGSAACDSGFSWKVGALGTDVGTVEGWSPWLFLLRLCRRWRTRWETALENSDYNTHCSWQSST